MENNFSRRLQDLTISRMMIFKLNNKRVIDESFEYESIYEIPTNNLHESDELYSKPFDREKENESPPACKVLSFKISYICEKNHEATEEIITFDENKMFAKLFLALKASLKKEKASSANDAITVCDNKNIDYFNAVSSTLTNLSSSENTPNFLLKILFEQGVDKSRFIQGFSRTVEVKEKYLTRKRKQVEPEEEFNSFEFIDEYVEDLSRISILDIKCMALINEVEGALILTLSIKPNELKRDLPLLPLTKGELKEKLQNWALGKLITLFNRKVHLMSDKTKINSMYQ